MPKRIYDDEQGDEEEISEDEMEQELEEQESPRKIKPKLPPLPPLPPARTIPRQPIQRRQPIQQQQQVQPQPVKRYQGFVQQAAEGVIDVETQEVIATDIWTALANIIERLERIENSIGSMLG